MFYSTQSLEMAAFLVEGQVYKKSLFMRCVFLKVVIVKTNNFFSCFYQAKKDVAS